MARAYIGDPIMTQGQFRLFQREIGVSKHGHIKHTVKAVKTHCSPSILKKHFNTIMGAIDGNITLDANTKTL